MKTTRYIVQYQDRPNHWTDTESFHTEAESLAVLCNHTDNGTTLDYRVVRRLTETTDEVIASIPAPKPAA